MITVTTNVRPEMSQLTIIGLRSGSGSGDRKTRIFVRHIKIFIHNSGFYCTFDRYGQRLAFPGDEGASAQLDPIQAVVVALVGALGAGKSESDGRGEGGKRLTQRAVGADQPQLEGAPGVLVRRGAGDVEAVAFNDGASRGLGGRVVPVLGGEEFHCAKTDRKV